MCLDPKIIRGLANNTNNNFIFSEVVDNVTGVTKSIKNVQDAIKFIDGGGKDTAVGRVEFRSKELFKDFFKEITGVSASIKGLTKQIFVPIAIEAGDALFPGQIFINEFEDTTGIKVVFDETEEDHDVAFLNDVFYAVSREGIKNTEISFTENSFDDKLIASSIIVGSDEANTFKFENPLIAGLNVFNTGAGDDRIIIGKSSTNGLSFDLFIDTGSDDDEIDIHASRSIIEAGTGNDIITIRDGEDLKIYGNSENQKLLNENETDDDIFVIEYSVVADVFGGSGFDTVDYKSRRVDLRDGSLRFHEGGFELTLNKNNVIDVRFSNVFDSEGNQSNQTLNSIEKVIGTNQDDIVRFESSDAFGRFNGLEIHGSFSEALEFINDKDTLDFKGFDVPIIANNFRPKNNEITIGGVKFIDFESIIGTDGNERLFETPNGNWTDDGEEDPAKVEEKIKKLVDRNTSLRDKVDILSLFYNHEYDNLGSLESVDLGEGQNFLAADGGRVTETEEFLTNPEEVEAGEEPIYEEREIVITPGLFEVTGGDDDDIIIIKNAAFQPETPAIPDDPNTPEDESSPFIAERRAEIDSGAGDDYIIAFGGTGAITIGGEGRDFIFNTSEFGQLYGDTLDGLDADGNELNHEGLENSDVFWFWPGTFIQDAQPNDILQIFGLPLVGGSNSIAGIPAGDGGLAIDFFSWTTFYGSSNSGQLLVYNAIIDLIVNGFDTDRGGDILQSVQVVENYRFGGFSNEQFGRVAPGDLGLTFRIFLPRDRADEGITISLFNAAWGSVFTYIDVAFNLAKLLCFVFIPPQTSRKYCY